jgi:hypothetical protein
MLLGAGFVIAFVVLPAFLGGDIEDDVLAVVLRGFGFCFCPRRPMRMTLLNMGVWLHFFVRMRRIGPLVLLVTLLLLTGLSAVCGTCLPNGCAVATHSQGDWTESAEGDPNLLWGRSPHLAEARSGFWKGERASEGRGCFERGTLNADRKANRKEPPSSTVLPHGASSKSHLRNSKSQSQYDRDERQRDLPPMPAQSR